VAFSRDLIERFCAAFPAVARRGLTPESVARVASGWNGQTLQYLACLAQCCAEDVVEKPPIVAKCRLRRGSVPLPVLREVERVLGMTPKATPRGPLRDAEEIRAQDNAACRDSADKTSPLWSLAREIATRDEIPLSNAIVLAQSEIQNLKQETKR